MYLASAAEYLRLARVPAARRTERQQARFERLDAPADDDDTDGHDGE